MKSNYRRIGDFIELVDQRNSELKVDLLLGLSINKEFIPSVANTVGTNMKNYKIIRKNQFACSIMQVRRDGKMPVALLKEFDEAIISQAYPVFEIVDEKLLLPDYLMMWFSRKEFDREATFHAVGGVRGSLEWEDFLNFELPVPTIERQQEIVTEYNTVVNRITLNEQLNLKLEETAQAMYKHWFVDFEFPVDLCQSEPVEDHAIDFSKGYKSSGGKMVYNEELDKEIPEGWRVEEIKHFGGVVTGKTPSSKTPEHFGEEYHFVTPSDFNQNTKFIFSTARGLSWVGFQKLLSKSLRSNDVIVTCIGSDMGKVALSKKNSITNQQMNSIKVNNQAYSDYLYAYFEEFRDELKSIAMGSSTMPMISKSDFERIRILKPNQSLLEEYHKLLTPFNLKLQKNIIESQKLKDLQTLLLSAMTRTDIEIEFIN